MGRPEKGLKQSLGAALWQWGRHRELPESADPIFEAAEMVYAALMGDPADLIAVVRSGVESGTIEGEVLPEATIRDKRGKYRNGDFIVLPVSDGGEDAE